MKRSSIHHIPSTLSAETAMINATKTRNRDEVWKALQHHNFNFKAVGYSGNTVVHSVIENQKLSEKEKVEVVEFLLQKGVDPNIENSDHLTALHFAVSTRDKSIIDLLLRYKVDINKRDKRDNTVAHYFISDEYYKFAKYPKNIEKREQESIEFVKWLISRRLDFDAKTKFKESAVYLAVYYKLQHILPVLLMYTEDINYTNNRGDSLLGLFLWNDSKNCIRTKQLYRDRYTIRILNILLDRGASTEHIHHSKLSALEIAIVRKRSIDVINTLAYHIPDEFDQSCIASRSFYQIIKSCSSWDNSRTETYLQTLSDLVTKGADVNHKYAENCTPLYWAVRARNLPVVEFLKKNGADFSVTTIGHQCLLHEILKENYCGNRITAEMEYSRMQIFNIIMDQGCDVNTLDEDNMSPLHMAAKLKNVQIHDIPHDDSDAYLAHNFRRMENEFDESDLDLVFTGELELDDYLTNNRKIPTIHRSYIPGNSHLHGPDADIIFQGDQSDMNDQEFSLKMTETDTIPNEMLCTLLKRGAVVNILSDRGSSALYVALLSARIGNVEELLQWGADINEDRVVALIPNLHESVRSVILNHRIKLKAVDLRCSEMPRDTRNERDQEFYECLKEVEKLKTTYLKENDSVSLYNFLHMNRKKKCTYLHSNELLSIVNSSTLEKDFPKYSVLILATYREAVSWKSLIEPTKEAWIKMTKIQLPDCLEFIFAYLNHNELMKIIKANNSSLKRDSDVDVVIVKDVDRVKKFKLADK